MCALGFRTLTPIPETHEESMCTFLVACALLSRRTCARVRTFLKCITSRSGTSPDGMALNNLRFQRSGPQMSSPVAPKL